MTQSGRSGPTSARRPVLFRLGVASSGSGSAGPTTPSRRQSDSLRSGGVTSERHYRDSYPTGHFPTISIFYETEKALTIARESRLSESALATTWQPARIRIPSRLSIHLHTSYDENQIARVWTAQRASPTGPALSPPVAAGCRRACRHLLQLFLKPEPLSGGGAHIVSNYVETAWRVSP
jgi:hypothetical protein